MTISRIYLHIGSDKAGSTAIQEALVANREWYIKRGIYIPEAGLRRSGYPNIFNDDPDESLVRQLKSELATCDAESVLLSWEGIHFYDEPERRRLRSLLDDIGPNATTEFIYYVRNQVDLIQSGLLQQIKQLRTSPDLVEQFRMPIDEVPKQLQRRYLFSRRREFMKVIKDWKSDFPAADFSVQLYDRAVLKNGDVVEDFNQILGLVSDSEFVMAPWPSNTTLQAEASDICARYWPLIWADGDRARFVDLMTTFTGGTSSFFPTETRDAIAQFFASDNHKLVQAYPRCAGIDTQRSKPAPENLDEVQDIADAYLSINAQYPTLLTSPLSLRALDRLTGSIGWEPARDNGRWMTGDRATIRFRPRGSHFGGYAETLIVDLRGRYHRQGDRSIVSVNGHDHGEVELGSESLVIPRAQLGPSFEVEIVIETVKSSLRMPSLNPERTFLLKHLSYQVLQP